MQQVSSNSSFIVASMTIASPPFHSITTIIPSLLLQKKNGTGQLSDYGVFPNGAQKKSFFALFSFGWLAGESRVSKFCQLRV